jgi:uncharacterized protein (DUF488 family)
VFHTRSVRIWSIGHGARPVADLVAVLREGGVVTLADVRANPGSRRHTQLGQSAQRASHADAGIAYLHLPGLGGLRDSRADSPHVALRVTAFRGYADHMGTQEFRDALAQLTAVASAKTTAFMCAETDWHSCHRRMLADALGVAGWDVTHLVAAGRSEPHVLWDVARVVDGTLVYDGGAIPLRPR